MTDQLAEPKRSNQKTVRMISGIAAVVLIITLIVIKNSNPAFTWKSFIISIVGIIVFFAGIIIAFYFIDKRSGQKAIEDAKAERLPPAVTTEQARELAERIIQGKAYGDYIEFEREYSQQYGKNVKSWIYTYIGEGKYENCKYFVVMNMHRPLEKFSVLTDPREGEWEFVKNSMADHPEQSPNVKETVRENPLLGTREVTREVVKESEEKKEDAKEGDS